MANLPIIQSYNIGADLTWQAIAATGDVFANDGRVVLIFRNTGASPTTITAISQKSFQNLPIDNAVMVLAAGEYRTMGPFSPSIFNADDSGVSLLYSGAGIADTDVLAVRIGEANLTAPTQSTDIAGAIMAEVAARDAAIAAHTNAIDPHGSILVTGDWAAASQAWSDVSAAWGLICPPLSSPVRFLHVHLWEGPADNDDYGQLTVSGLFGGGVSASWSDGTSNHNFTSPPISGVAYIIGIAITDDPPP